MEIDTSKNTGETLYLGSTSSELYMCAYQKNCEQYVKNGTEIEDTEIKNRFEFRMKNERVYYAVVDFLKNRLDLDISPEKSKVTNLQKNSSEFLGFKIKVLPKKSSRYGYIAKTDMCNKAFNKVKANIKNNLKDIQMHTVKENIIKYNNAIIGAHNYYCVATNVYNNFDRIDFELLRTHKNRLRNKAKRVRFSEVPKDFQKFVQGVRGNRRIYKLMDMYMVPIVGVHHKSPMNFSQDITDYSESGRK